MLTGLPPFYSNNRVQMYQEIALKEVSFPFLLSRQACDLMRKMLFKDP
jgi:hypothetical protein